MNERKTEKLVRDYLDSPAFNKDRLKICVEEQKSEVLPIKRLLKNASKSGGPGRGAPEFIVSCSTDPDFLLIFECKPNIKFHESPKHDDPVRFAVDGVLHYSSFLSKDFNVISCAVSGETKSQMKVSTFLWPKGAKAGRPLDSATGSPIRNLIPWEDYISNATFNPSIQKLRFDELMEFSRNLHSFMRDHAKLSESEKPLLVSGTLLALHNSAFVKSFDAYSPEDLQSQWLNVIKEELGKVELPQAKKTNVIQPYSTIAVHPELGKATKQYPRGVLYELIKMLNEKVWPFISVYHNFDVVGQFYGEFLKYTGGDKKALGIVLTPRHITELFALLANVKKNDKVLDICAGTGGFLISAMHQMMKQTSTKKEQTKIKKEGLFGIEQQPNMYALAASNMILRGDGKANLYQGDCFNETIAKEIKAFKCNVGMLNPPYSQTDKDLHELYFVKQMLDCLKQGGVGICIVPMACAISPHPAREEILNSHTLEAVMSMPNELFQPGTATVTCIMVFTAHVSHEEIPIKRLGSVIGKTTGLLKPNTWDDWI